MPRSCPKHAWLFDAACAMSGCKKIVIFKKITSALSKSVSKFVEIQSRLTFSCKSWKNVSQIIDFADIFPDFLCFLHSRGIFHLKNSILWKFADKISKINKFYQRRKIYFFSRQTPHPSNYENVSWYLSILGSKKPASETSDTYKRFKQTGIMHIVFPPPWLSATWT